MKFNKPNYWSKKFSLISFFLIPLTLIVILFSFIRRKLTKSIKFNIPIICIGNIYIGGTGKTPMAIFLGDELLKLGNSPVILRKFYKSHSDEHNLIKGKFDNLILCENRFDGIKKAEKENHNTVILDDGFQDHKIHKDLNILCFNQKQLVGNGMVLPSGPLRESLTSLKFADIILINGKKDVEFENKVFQINKDLKIFYTNYRPLNIEQFRNKKLLALAGIGNPNNFFELLEENNLIIKKKLIFPDHYEFNQVEVQKIIDDAHKEHLDIIMTEKDYYKVKKFNDKRLNYLKVSLDVDKKVKLIQTIIKIYDKKN
jgi:tetraacyldisaccharide 4'-kinase